MHRHSSLLYYLLTTSRRAEMQRIGRKTDCTGGIKSAHARGGFFPAIASEDVPRESSRAGNHSVSPPFPRHFLSSSQRERRPASSSSVPIQGTTRTGARFDVAS